MNGHPVQWQTPQPLWGRFGAVGSAAALSDDQARPAILRFVRDDFMEELLGTLARDPSRLGRFVARPETWRSPMAEGEQLVARTPIPRVAEGALRRTFALTRKPTVPAADRTSTQVEGATVRELPLKLYQVAHQRHYLIGASLVCGVPGLPDRAVTVGGGEQINFVVRRLMPSTPGSTDPTDLHEFAFVRDGDGSHWRRVGDDESRVVAGEEMLPTFRLSFHDDGDRGRSLWAGTAPVGRREEYMSTQVDRSPAATYAKGQRDSLDVARPTPSLSKLARLSQFQMEVAEPWKNLIRTSYRMSGMISAVTVPDPNGEDPLAKRQRLFESNLQQQQISWLLLLDFADFLTTHLNDLWNVIAHDGVGLDSLSPQRKALYDWLGRTTAGTSTAMSPLLVAGLTRPVVNTEIRPPAASLRSALKAIRADGVREKLERTELSYTPSTLASDEWPAFHYLLAGVNVALALDGPFVAFDALGAASENEAEPDPVRPLIHSPPESVKVDRLTALVARALVATTEVEAPPVPFAMQIRNALAATIGDAGWFVARFVYTNPECGPIHPPRISAPTQRFQLANFFDPDAPARPIRITLPTDTSPAGLRKHNKNTALVVSDMLCGQIQRAKGMGLIDLVLSVLPWPLHKDLDLGDGSACNNGSVNIGMICSLSIPIITICALILLIIIVSLLDFVFRWLPFFIFCFPLPKFTAKKATA